jgi:divalent metal cation (Fe/Co/Zn/Cd) transporter
MSLTNVNEKRFKDALFVFFTSVVLMFYGLTELIHLLIGVTKYTLYSGVAVFVVGICIFYVSLEILKEAFQCLDEEKPEDSQ